MRLYTNFHSALTALGEYKQNPALAPKQLIEELCSFYDTEISTLGLANVGGEGYIIHAANKLGKEVALKVPFPREVAAPIGEGGKRFLEGAKIQKAIYDNLGTASSFFSVPDVYRIKQSPFLIMEMEWIHSIPVLRWFREESPTLLDKLTVFANLLKAASWLHNRGIIHRDLSPDNVLIGRSNTVCILDWSMSKEIGDRNLTVQGVGLGKVPFASPLQATNARAATPVDEVHYLGWTFASFVLGKQIPIPYDEGEASYRKSLAKMRELTLAEPKFNPIFTPIFKRATCLDEEGRFTSAEEFLSEIEDLQYQLKNTQEGREVLALPKTKYPKYDLAKPAEADWAAPLNKKGPESEQITIVDNTVVLDYAGLANEVANTVTKRCRGNNPFCRKRCEDCIELNQAITSIIIETVVAMKMKGLI